MSAGAKSIFERYTADDAIDYINSLPGVEYENYLLDFKQMTTNAKGGLADPDKTNYSQAISGFANSEGGVIVWGIECNPTKADGRDVVKGLHPIKNLKNIKYDLHRIEPDMTDPAISGIDHHIIETTQGSDEGFIATFIPRTDSFPIMAMGPKTQRCYYRGSHSFLYMRHRMLADRFAKGQLPRIDLDWIYHPGAKQLWLLIKNTGTAIARDIAFTVDVTGIPPNSAADLKLAEKRGFKTRIRNNCWLGISMQETIIPRMDYLEILSFNMPVEKRDFSFLYQVSCEGDFKNSILKITKEELEAGKTEASIIFPDLFLDQRGELE